MTEGRNSNTVVQLVPRLVGTEILCVDPNAPVDASVEMDLYWKMMMLELLVSELQNVLTIAIGTMITITVRTMHSNTRRT